MKKLVAVVSSLLVALPLCADTKPQFGEQLEVSVVEVAVNVVGRDGKSVHGLTKANFELYDDGQKRTIDDVDVVDTAPASMRAPGVIAPRITPSARRSFLVLFDLTNSTPPTVLRAREAARSFIARDVREGDLVGVATFSVEAGFRLMTAFTSDRDLLISAVDTLGSPKNFRITDPLLLSGRQTGEGSDSARPTGASTDKKSAMLEETARDLDRMNRQADDSYRRARVEQQLDNFAAVAKALDHVSGRKQVILLSEGFDASLLAGRERLNSQESIDENTAVAAGEVWKVDSDRRYGNSAASARLQKMGEIFKRSDVVLHCIDIKGLRSNVDARDGLKENSNEGLYLLANSTGGQVFKNDNDLAGSFDRLLQEQEVTYVLTFRAPRTKNPGAFHTLKVKVRDAAVGRVFHRAGYYEAGGSLSPMEQTLSAVDIMMNDIPLRDVPLTVMAVPFPTETASAQVPVIIEIPGDKLIESASGDTIDAELFVYAFDKGDSVEDFLYQKIALDLKKVGDVLRKSGIKYYGTLSLPAGDYALRTLLRVHGSNRDGFERTELRVPDFGVPTVLQPFVFEEPGKWIMVKGNSHAKGVEYPFHVDQSFIPAASPIVDTNKPSKIALFTYNIGENMELSANVEDAHGTKQSAKLSLAGKTPVDDDGATKLLFDFDAGGLAPGQYRLAFDVRDPSRQKQRSVSLPITIR